MAHRKPIVIGTVGPLGTVGAGAGALIAPPGNQQVTERPIILNAGPDAVYIGTPDQSVFVIARLTGPPDPAPPQPRYTTTDRFEEFSIVKWAGHDPYTMALPIKLDRGGARSIEADIRALWRLLGGGSPTRPSSPPVLRLVGPVPHDTLRWRARSFEVEDRRTVYLPNTDDRCRFAGTLTLVQHVADEQLQSTLTGSNGIRPRTTRTRPGEDFYDVSKRMYGNRSHAGDIARANGVGVGYKPPTGYLMRIP